jgi:hypothetical protein
VRGPFARFDRLSLLLWALRASAALMGVAHAAISIHDHMMNEDGISYLDLGDRNARGDWLPVSSMWSPLYPLLLGLVMRVSQPSPRWEFAVAHLLTLAIYIGALAAFEFFWRGIWRATSNERSATNATIGLPPWAWWLAGYAIFVWSSVVLIRFRAVTPDMLVAALVYGAAGLLVRTASTERPVRIHAALGGVLGAAYLAKAVMFPLGFLFLAAAVGLAWRSPERRRASVVGLAAFMLIAAPLIALTSAAAGRLTFGEAGQFTYLKHVNGLSYPYNASEIPDGLGTPVHPIRIVHEGPTVYEFATPIAGTYPPGYDPGYWVEGLTPRLELERQARHAVQNVVWYGELFFRQLGGPLALVLVLLWMGREQRPRAAWPFAIVGVASLALGLYALVYVEGRYIAPFVVMFLAGALSLVRLADSAPARRVMTAAGMLVPALIVVELAVFDAPYVRRFGTPGRLTWERQTATARADAPWRIAEALGRLGVRPGDPIGFIGYSFGATFARLAKVRIVAEMPWEETDRFWSLDPGGRAEVLDAFGRVGAVALVTEVPPPAGAEQDWVELDGSGRYALMLKGGS